MLIGKYTIFWGYLIISLSSCASLKTNTIAYELMNREKVLISSFSSAENKLAVMSRDGFITIWDLNNGNMVREINTNRNEPVNSMLFTNYGNIIVHYKNDNRKIAIYDSNDFLEPIILGPYNSIEYLTCSPDGRSVIFSSVSVSRGQGTTTVTTRERITGTPPSSIETEHGTQTSANFSYSSERKDTVNTSITTYTRVLHARAMTLDSMNFVINLPQNSETSIVDIRSGLRNSNERRYSGSWGSNNQTTGVSVDPVNNRVAVGFSNGTIRIYNAENNRLIRSFTIEHSAINGLSFSPDGSRLLIGTGQFISLWNCETWSKIGERKIGIQKSLEYSPDGKRFIVKDSSNTFIIFNSQNARELNRATKNRVRVHALCTVFIRHILGRGRCFATPGTAETVRPNNGPCRNPLFHEPAYRLAAYVLKHAHLGQQEFSLRVKRHGRHLHRGVFHPAPAFPALPAAAADVRLIRFHYAGQQPPVLTRPHPVAYLVQHKPCGGVGGIEFSAA